MLAYLLTRLLILLAAVLAAALDLGCSLHYVQSTDGQVLDLEVLRAVAVNQVPEQTPSIELDGPKRRN